MSTFAWPNVVIVLYTFVGWALGVSLLAASHPGLNVIGVLLTAHTLICSAYLIHECIHHTVFESIRPNDRLGMLLQQWRNTAYAWPRPELLQALRSDHAAEPHDEPVPPPVQ